MAESFAGFIPSGAAFSGWVLETVRVKRIAADGRHYEYVAEDVPCKADGERMGLRLTEAGAFPAYERKFFFSCTYTSGGAAKSFLSLLQLGDIIVDSAGHEWRVDSIANPGGANEHLEVIGHRSPAAPEAEPI